MLVTLFSRIHQICSTHQLNNTTTQLLNSTTAQQHNSTTAQQHNDKTPHDDNTTRRQHHNTTTKQHHNTTTPQHWEGHDHNTTTQHWEGVVCVEAIGDINCNRCCPDLEQRKSWCFSFSWDKFFFGSSSQRVVGGLGNEIPDVLHYLRQIFLWVFQPVGGWWPF